VFIQAEDGIRDRNVTGVQTCALPILSKQNAPDVKAIAYIFITICLLSVLFVSVFWLDDHIKTPIWTIEAPFVYIIGIVITAILIGLSWWTKTWKIGRAHV